MKYSDLRVWQEAMDLVQTTYEITRQFPADERFGLITQLQRAAISIASNIVEGHGRKSTRAYINHLSIAFGSLMELETQLRIANRLNYLDLKKLEEILENTETIGKMLSGLISSLKMKIANAVTVPQSAILNPQSD